VEKLNVVHFNVDFKISINILKNLFNEVIVKKKLISSFINISFFGRPFFFSSDISELLLGGLNLEMHSRFKFRYILYNRLFLKKKFSPFIRKFDRNSFRFIFYIIISLCYLDLALNLFIKDLLVFLGILLFIILIDEN
jgi:hypothetical protein